MSNTPNGNRKLNSRDRAILSRDDTRTMARKGNPENLGE